MNEYLKKENVIYLLEHNDKVIHYVQMTANNIVDRTVLTLCDVVNEMPAEDVKPVKHGKWEETHISLCKWIPEDEKEAGHSFYMAELKCSCCKRYNAVTFALTLNKPDFCQLCGARMIKDGDTECQ